MKKNIGTVLWVAGAVIVAWALSVSLSMMLDFTNEAAKEYFRQGTFILGALVMFAFVFRAKLKSVGIVEKLLMYVLIPAAGIAVAAYGWLMEFSPATLAAMS